MRIGRELAPAVVALLLPLACVPLSGLAAVTTVLDGQIAQLDALREQCVNAAAAVRQRETSIGALDMAIKVMERGAEAKKREITQSRAEQEALLGALERLARAPPEALAFAPEGLVDRRRSAILIGAAVPALSARARQLGGQLAALSSAQGQIEARRTDVDEARAALAKGREELTKLVSRRDALIELLLHQDGKPVAASPLGDQASDLVDLIKQADAAADQRDKALSARLRVLYGASAKASPLADPTRPKSLRALDAPRAEMTWPVAGEVSHRFGDADRFGRPSQGLTLQATPGGLVVAPFDGRVDYAGPFRGYGLILIIRHGGGYHSLLAGLGRVDVKAGQWLLAGEPVGSLADADDKDGAATVYLELRRDERPVDPQSRLASRDLKTEDTRVRE